MSLYSSTNAETRAFPGIEVLQIGSGVKHEEFQEFINGLITPPHYGMDGGYVSARPAHQVGDVMAITRSAENPGDSWTPNRYWHADGSAWPDLPLFASVLYAQKLEGGSVASTGIIDTALLLKAMEEDHPGLTEELSQSRSIHTKARYFEKHLPENGGKEAVERTLRAKGVIALSELGIRYPNNSFPATPVHPFWVDRTPCTMIDDLRVVKLTGISSERSKAILDLVRKDYINLPPKELNARPYHYEHEWEEGYVLIFPQVGTLHRAHPSPDTEERRDMLRAYIA